MYFTNIEVYMRDNKPGALPLKPHAFAMISSTFYRSKINKLRTFDYCASSLKSDLPSFSGLNKETSSKKEYQNFYRFFQDL